MGNKKITKAEIATTLRGMGDFFRSRIEAKKKCFQERNYKKLKIVA